MIAYFQTYHFGGSFGGRDAEEPDLRIISDSYAFEVHQTFVTHNAAYLESLLPRARTKSIHGKSMPSITVPVGYLCSQFVLKFLEWLYDDDLLRTAMFRAKDICEFEYIAKKFGSRLLRRAVMERSHLEPDYLTWENVNSLLDRATIHDLEIVRGHVIRFLARAPTAKWTQACYLAEIYDVRDLLQELFRECPEDAMKSGFYSLLSAPMQNYISTSLFARKQARGLLGYARS
ncbi:hypothetical protein HDU86_006761 [Geranomyces michiganensis]|nr:hypothetical protein HDU86_006761 [Geranomyces michiganensis]